MKQAELNKLLNSVFRQSAKAHGWESSRGFIYKATDLLFFSLVIVGQAKRHRLFYSLGYKLLAFDELFWKIVNLEENLKQPLSFRAFGAWTAPQMVISEGEVSIVDWETEIVELTINQILTGCEPEAEKVCREINGLDDNLRVIEQFYMRLKDQYPNAVTNIWVERLLTSILKHEHCVAEEIVRDRMNSHDSGGFQVGSKSFYELANEHLRGIA
jgi:hypothetical protein